MIVNKKYLIGQELLRRDIISEDQLEEGIQYQTEKKLRLGQALLELGYITEKDLLIVLADQLGIEYVDLEKHAVDESVLGTVPFDLAQKFKAFPVAVKDDIITVAVIDPLDIANMYDLQLALDKKIIPAIASPDDIDMMIKRYYS